MRHLDYPFDGTLSISWGFGAVSALEPDGYRYGDGSVGYVSQPGAVAGHYHNGVDFPCPLGTPLLSSAAGTVTFAGWDATGFGNRVSVDLGGGLSLLVGHLSHVNVKVGQHVGKHALLGLSGTTGNSTGPHVHWSVLVQRTWGRTFVDPLPYVQAEDKPLPKEPAKGPAHDDTVAAAHLTELARKITTTPLKIALVGAAQRYRDVLAWCAAQPKE